MAQIKGEEQLLQDICELKHKISPVPAPDWHSVQHVHDDDLDGIDREVLACRDTGQELQVFEVRVVLGNLPDHVSEEFDLCHSHTVKRGTMRPAKTQTCQCCKADESRSPQVVLLGFSMRCSTFIPAKSSPVPGASHVPPWLPREVVDAPSLEVFKTKLDGVLRNLVFMEGIPPHGKRVGTM
ncbi:hypothetical protein HGM15179_011617 [Zosterops borbonicus]|uniref:Uncharacterized protein n=1 Tax=Zosterops borbonicus TaxID=364589 RepID=A0A8K1GCI9_9PASS|nr:hypothetical protein HGM15179_011617 [Zosterops borbonicus]